MSIVNICTQELGAEIVAFSSASEDDLIRASHVLLDQEDVP